MGTHPIFESDFDCLTENGSKMPLNVLYESPVGFALFSVLDEGKFKEVSDVQSIFADPSSLGGVLQLKKRKRLRLRRSRPRRAWRPRRRRPSRRRTRKRRRRRQRKKRKSKPTRCGNDVRTIKSNINLCSIPQN